MAVLIAIRCKACIRAYVKMAHAKGASQDELIQFLEVSMTMQGRPGEEWALKAYVAFKDCIDAEAGSETSACCQHEVEEVKE